MPAASAAAIPLVLSSITRQAAGGTAKWRAANRKISGNGFPCATSAELNIRPSNRESSEVMLKVLRILTCGPFDAMQ